MIKTLKQIYRYFKYARKDVYVSSLWLQEFDAGHKDSLIIT